MIYPIYPDISLQESSLYPIRVLTAAALLPEVWDKRLVYVNVRELQAQQIA